MSEIFLSFKYVGLYFFIELFFRIIFRRKLGDQSKLVRNCIVLAIYISVLFFIKAIERTDFSLTSTSWVLLLLYSLVILFYRHNLVRNESHQSSSLMFSALIFAPVIEEIICRKLIIDSLSQWNLNGAVIISLFVFIVLHFSFEYKDILIFFLAGALLTILQLTTDKVINPILLHSMINYLTLMKMRQKIESKVSK